VKLCWQSVPKVHIVNEEEELSLDLFGLNCYLPTLTLVGDTKYKEPDMELLRPFFIDLAWALTKQDMRVAVIDGATDFGVMRLFNEACEQIGNQPTALIGVTLQTAVEKEEMPLGSHHSHILLTPGGTREWAAVVPWMRQVQSIVTGGKKPSALLAVGGGAITLRHMREHAAAEIPLYVLLGSGLLSQGFVEARKDIPDPMYPFPIDEHKHLLSNSSLTLLDLTSPRQAIDEIMKSLYDTKPVEPH